MAIDIGLFGIGHLGKIHLQQLLQLPVFNVIGVYDPDEAILSECAASFGVTAYNNPLQLIEACDAVDVVCPTQGHFEVSALAIRHSCHVFIEKPVTASLEEAASLIKLADEAGVKVQVGHVERFNPAFLAARPYCDQPMFIENHRLAQFNPRGTDVSVVLDLMIHDIDIVLKLVRSEIKRISASGVSIISETPDIANARIEFNNGCVANLTSSRISMKNMRKTRLFQHNAYVSIDFLEKKTEVVQMEDAPSVPDPLDIIVDPGMGKKKKRIKLNHPETPQNNAIFDELQAFASAIENDTEPIVPITDGYEALKISYQIIEKLEN